MRELKPRGRLPNVESGLMIFRVQALYKGTPTWQSLKTTLRAEQETNMNNIFISHRLFTLMVLTPLLTLFSVPATAVDAVLISIHADPHRDGGPESRSSFPDGYTNWQRLSRLAVKAKQKQVRLTIQMSHNWIEYALGDPTRIDTVKTWINDLGHQVGFHHHDITHLAQPVFDSCGIDKKDWNVGLNAPWFSQKTQDEVGSWEDVCLPVFDKDIGTDLMCEFETALESGQNPVLFTDQTRINSATFGTEKDTRNYEWKAPLIYSQSSAVDEHAPMTVFHSGSLARSTCDVYGEYVVAELGSNPFSTASPGTGPNAQAVAADLQLTDWAPGDYVSVTFHPSEYEPGNVDNEINRLINVVSINYGANEVLSEMLDTKSCARELNQQYVAKKRQSWCSK